MNSQKNDIEKTKRKYFSAFAAPKTDRSQDDTPQRSEPYTSERRDSSPQTDIEKRSQFMDNKQRQSSQSGRFDDRLEKLSAGTIEAVADIKRIQRKRKTQIHGLKKEQEQLLGYLDELIPAINRGQDKNAKLKKQMDKCKKRTKHLSREMEETQKILVLLCQYLKISGRKASFDELGSDLKCACKDQHRQQKNSKNSHIFS